MSTLESVETPSASAAMTSARLVRLFEPGGAIVARNGRSNGVRVMSVTRLS